MKRNQGVFIPILLFSFAAALFFSPQRRSIAYEAVDHLPDVEVVDAVDIEQFMGIWYVIAEIPNLYSFRRTSCRHFRQAGRSAV